MTTSLTSSFSSSSNPEGASAVRGFWHGIRAIHLGSGSKSVPNTQLELEKKLLDCEDGRTLAALVASTGEHGLPPREAAAALSRLAELVEEGTTGEAEAREALSTMWR